MIVPSIDLSGGQAVQWIGGAEPAIEAGDPRPLAERFGRVGEVAVVDLDAALGRGDHRECISDLLRLAPCRVGGGLRDAASALFWLQAGASKVVLGTAATPEVLTALPRERVIAAVDARDGEVVVDGWRRRTGESVETRLAALAPHVGGFLVTLVEREGRMGGVDLKRAARLAQAANGRPLTLAGGVADAEEIGALDRLGIDAQVGMALYTGRFSLADALWACLRSDRPDGLVPSVVVDESERALGLVYSSRASVAAAIERGQGVYHSRQRGLWVKGEGSGATQELLDITLDCDRDALRMRVRQRGPGFCHREQFGCFGPARGLAALERTLFGRRAAALDGAAPAGSYSARLFADPNYLAAKLREEADELARAVGPVEVAEETADVLFFALARLVSEGVDLARVEGILDRRALAVRRRSEGAQKPGVTP